MENSEKILNDTLYNSFASKWRAIGPPWRPSLRDCLFADEHIKKIKKDVPLKALVLGATPEWRDVLHMNGTSVTLFDRKESMVKNMTSLRYYESVGETFVEGAWLDIKDHFEEGEFDIVISDRPQDNIPYKEWNILWSGIRGILKPGGIFLIGVTNNDFTQQTTLKNLLDTYRSNPGDFDYHYQRIIWLYNTAVDCEAYDFDKYEINFEKFRKNLIEKGREYGATDEELDAIWFIRDDIFTGSFGVFIEVLPPLNLTIESLENAGFKKDDIGEDSSASFMSIKRMICLKK